MGRLLLPICAYKHYVGIMSTMSQIDKIQSNVPGASAPMNLRSRSQFETFQSHDV